MTADQGSAGVPADHDHDREHDRGHGRDQRREPDPAQDREQQFEEWSARLVRTIAGEVRRYRQIQGLSVQQLSDRVADRYGMRIKRSVLSNLEHGRRTTLSVAELFVLAHALRVPPLQLLFPIGRQEQIDVLPALPMPTWHAARWFTAERPLPPRPGPEGTPERAAEDVESWEVGAIPARWYREHDELLALRSSALLNAGSAEHSAMMGQREWQAAAAEVRQLEAALNGREPTAAEAAALDRARERLLDAEIRQNTSRSACDAHYDRARDLEYALAGHRRQMRRSGLLPPPLPRDLEHVDDDDFRRPSLTPAGVTGVPDDQTW